MDSPARPSQPKMASSTGGTEGSSPASSPASAASLAAMAAPKFGTLVPNRIFVGGISASTSEAELAQLFSAYGNVKATKIIADRGGVSKGYGFVTFETEEEAKRLQQESECIVLRERKLNIAPAIKKQPFNRSFDGGTGSPPAVPTSTYYYANGMGLPYQNSMTFFNAGAPAPGAAIAPPTDPATMYQAAGVFGPQATASHQTFAPMMYPVPAPSLYMPQQYQYSPMPYEPYYPGTTAAGGPQFLYATNGAQPASSGSNNGSGNSSSGTAPGASSPASATAAVSASLGPSPPQFQTHYYGPGSHHHPAHGPPAPPPPPQMEHLYYTYPPQSHVAQPPPHHGPLGEQLLIYSTDMSAQPSSNDSQLSQPEDNRSTSSHSEQLQQGGNATTDTGGGGGGGGGGSNVQSASQPADPNAPAMLQFMPLKYPQMLNRYTTPNFHPVSLQHSPQASAGSPQTNAIANDSAGSTSIGDDLNNSANAGNSTPVHYRTMSIYPTTLFVPHAAQYPGTTANQPGASLLPTPPQQPYDLSGKYHSKSGLLGSPYAKGPPHGASPLLHHPQSAYIKQYNGPPLQPSHGGHHKYPRVTTPPSRLSHHQGQQTQYGKRGSQATYYFSQKSCQYGGPGPRTGHQPFVYGPQTQFSPYAMPHPGSLPKGSYTLSYENSRRNYSSDHTDNYHPGIRQGNRKNAVSNYRGSNLTMSATATPSSATPVETISKSECAKPGDDATATTTTSSSTETETSATPSKTPPGRSNDNSPPPPPASNSPMTRPHPNLSPSPNPNQVQYFVSSSGNQRNNSSSFGQQQRSSRYPTSTSMSSRGGKSQGPLRQTGAGKYKMNGIVQTGGKLSVADEVDLGGAGDAPPVVRMPLTPPGTPQQSQTPGATEQQLNESCHQMQALRL
ncbi:trithorax group protein osa isoform X1 [Nasonia vitripennis]|uniref:RRM domain-containing protein n=1 Tax=Nasonia vitripennis TaxID=7425 RepID=A0A7M7T7S1_NASVI|nr:trithorax group protein osa isoform X1 [Nasonia vitripennis]